MERLAEEVKVHNSEAAMKTASSGEEINNVRRDARTRKVPIRLDEDLD